MADAAGKAGRDALTRWTYMTAETAYRPGEAPGECGEFEPAPGEHQTLREAIQAFLSAAGYDAEGDGALFFPRDSEGRPLVAFARVEADGLAHERLALFFRADVRATVRPALPAEVRAAAGLGK